MFKSLTFNRLCLLVLFRLLSGTRQFRSQLQVSAVSCDASAPIGALIAQNVSLFLAQASQTSSSILVHAQPHAQPDPLATHIPTSCMSRTLSLRFPRGGGLDNTTAILCCRVTDPISVQSIEVECDRLNVQWYRVVTQMQRTPAIKLALTNLSFEHFPLADEAASASPSASPLPSHSTLSSLPPPSHSSTLPPQAAPSVPRKGSFLCDGVMQVSINYRRASRFLFSRNSFNFFAVGPQLSTTKCHMFCRCTTVRVVIGTASLSRSR